MRYLVSGGSGFIGSALARHLVRDVGADVLVFDKLTYAGNLSSLRDIADDPRFRFVKGDICDYAAMSAAIEAFAPDVILHLAAESHVDRSIAASDVFIQTNIVGTATILEAARAYLERVDSKRRENFRFIQLSTDEVYGSLGRHGCFTETSPYDPSSPYSASKASGDHLASAWLRTYGLPVIIVHASNNYGPYQLHEKLIPKTVLNALEGREIPVYGAGENVRDWLHVEDHVRALHLIATRGRIGERYNVGGRSERTNMEVVLGICAALDELHPSGAPHAALVRHVVDRPGHDLRYAIDATKLESELGWRATETFEAGLRKTIRWYLDNEWWWGPLRAGARADRVDA